MIIDVNGHWLPENLFTDQDLLNRFIRSVPRGYGKFVELTTIPGTDMPQVVVSQPKGYPNLNPSPTVADWKHRVEIMDEAGVDKEILRLCCWPEWMDLETCKIFNNLMAETVKKYPGRFLGLAAVPPWGDKESFYELDRCINELGLCGVVCTAHYGTLYLDAEEFRPFFRKINQLGVPICLHHTPLPVEYDHVYDNENLRRMWGRCSDMVTSLARIIFSGLLDECPNLTIIPTFLGGGFFAYTTLFAPSFEMKVDAKHKVAADNIQRFDKNMSSKLKGYLKQNLYFDVAHAPAWSKAQLECAVKEFGADHVLFGSSYPVSREWLLKGPEYIRSLDIGEKEKALILGGNAAKLFKIKT